MFQKNNLSLIIKKREDIDAMFSRLPDSLKLDYLFKRDEYSQKIFIEDLEIIFENLLKIDLYFKEFDHERKKNDIFKKNDLLEADFTSLKKLTKNLHTTTEQHEHDYWKLEESYKQMEIDLAIKESIIEEMKNGSSSNCELKQKSDALKNEIELKEKEFRNKIIEYRKEIDELTEKIHNLEEDKNEFKMINEKNQDEKEKLKIKLAKYKKKYKKETTNYENKSEKLNEKYQSFKENNKILLKQNEEFSKNIEILQTKINSLKNYNKEFLSKSTNQNDKYKNLEKEYNLLKQKHEFKTNSSKNFLPYDFIININSLKTFIHGWKIESSKKNTNLFIPGDFSVVGFVGREKIGKTFILNKLCGFDLASGSNVSTKGLSMKYSNKNKIVCLDSAGTQTPIYYYKPKVMQRFNITKEKLKVNEEIKIEMLNDKVITEIFIQDFMLDVCEAVIIVVGQLSQTDQKIIERIKRNHQSKKKIIIIHNFSNLYTRKDVEKSIEKDIMMSFDIIQREVSDSKIMEYIEKSSDKTKENISHLVLGSENYESGDFYNEKTFEYIQDLMDTLIEKREFRVIDELKNYVEENYRKYLQFKKIPKKGVSLKYDEEKQLLSIKCEEDYEVSNSIFNSLGNLIFNPPYEVFVRKDKYICAIEIPNLMTETIRFKINKKKTVFNCLVVQAIKKPCKFLEEENEKILGNRNYGKVDCFIPLGPNSYEVFLSEDEGAFDYKSGILTVEVFMKEEKIHLL